MKKEEPAQRVNTTIERQDRSNFHSQPAVLIHISCCLNVSKTSAANLTNISTHLNVYLNVICF